MPLVSCPNCTKEAEYTGNEFRPFCSEQCKLIDFGVWAEGGYSLPAETSSLSEEDFEQMEKVLSEQQRN